MIEKYILELIQLLLTEKRTQASIDAEKRGLKHISHGNYADASGDVVARSVDGKLVDVPKKPDNSATTSTSTPSKTDVATQTVTPAVSALPASTPTTPAVQSPPKKIRDSSRKVGEVWTDEWGYHKVKNSDKQIVQFSKHQDEIAKYYADRTLPRPESMNMNTPKGFTEQLPLLPTAQSFGGATDLGTVKHTSKVMNEFFPEISNRYSATNPLLDNIDKAEKKTLRLLKKNPKYFDLVDSWKASPPESIQDRKRVSEEFSELIRSQDLRVPSPELARGMKFSEPALAAKFLQQFKTGGTVDLPTCSWTGDTVVAENFAKMVEQNNGLATTAQDTISVMLKLTSTNSKGIQGMQVPSQLHGAGSDEISGEEEVLAPAGKFKVVGISVGEKDEFISYSEKSDGLTTHPGTKRPFYMIHLEQVENVSENTKSSNVEQLKKLNVFPKLNLAYLTCNMKDAPAGAKDIKKLSS